MIKNAVNFITLIVRDSLSLLARMYLRDALSFIIVSFVYMYLLFWAKINCHQIREIPAIQRSLLLRSRNELHWSAQAFAAVPTHLAYLFNCPEKCSPTFPSNFTSTLYHLSTWRIMLYISALLKRNFPLRQATASSVSAFFTNLHRYRLYLHAPGYRVQINAKSCWTFTISDPCNKVVLMLLSLLYPMILK